MSGPHLLSNAITVMREQARAITHPFREAELQLKMAHDMCSSKGVYCCPSCSARYSDAQGLYGHFAANESCRVTAGRLALWKRATSRCTGCRREFLYGDEMHLGEHGWQCAACYDADTKRAADPKQEVPC